MAKGERKMAKIASRPMVEQAGPVYTCPADGTKLTWVQYFAENGRGRMALRCEKCGATKFRSEL